MKNKILNNLKNSFSTFLINSFSTFLIQLKVRYIITVSFQSFISYLSELKNRVYKLIQNLFFYLRLLDKYIMFILYLFISKLTYINPLQHEETIKILVQNIWDFWLKLKNIIFNIKNINIENLNKLITDWLYDFTSNPLFYMVLAFIAFFLILIIVYKQDKLKMVIFNFFTWKNFYKICLIFFFGWFIRLGLKQYDIMFFQNDILFTISAGITIPISSFISKCFDFINIKSPFQFIDDVILDKMTKDKSVNKFFNQNMVMSIMPDSSGKINSVKQNIHFSFLDERNIDPRLLNWDNTNQIQNNKYHSLDSSAKNLAEENKKKRKIIENSSNSDIPLNKKVKIKNSNNIVSDDNNSDTNNLRARLISKGIIEPTFAPGPGISRPPKYAIYLWEYLYQAKEIFLLHNNGIGKISDIKITQVPLSKDNLEFIKNEIRKRPDTSACKRLLHKTDRRISRIAINSIRDVLWSCSTGWPVNPSGNSNLSNSPIHERVHQRFGINQPEVQYSSTLSDKKRAWGIWEYLCCVDKLGVVEGRSKVLCPKDYKINNVNLNATNKELLVKIIFANKDSHAYTALTRSESKANKSNINCRIWGNVSITTPFLDMVWKASKSNN